MKADFSSTYYMPFHQIQHEIYKVRMRKSIRSVTINKDFSPSPWWSVSVFMLRGPRYGKHTKARIHVLLDAFSY
ncbi:hypothetical protein XELAEV_18047766mg [Xenopus laevis]|uniref:Uncharacterized protein n=1 Tax=Xenopus laevis TaxID=8355 RepID=A0A974BW39_XENLA|nr:hypothetical protein XELAEV_18047766mg [Xenopus laevis]